MLFEKFSREVVSAFNPRYFNELSSGSFFDGVKYFTKVLVIAYIIMAILFLPKFVSLKGQIQSELSKFDAFSISGNVVQSDRIKIPEKEPIIIIDATSSDVVPGKERITITKDALFYKFFAGRKEIPMSQIKNLDNEVVSRLLVYFFVFILPSLVFYTFGSIWVKYFLFSLLVGTIVFLMADLTRFSQPWKSCAVAACYSSTLIILVEMISAALYPKWMIPLLSVWSLHVYLVPLVAWVVLSLFFVSCLHFFKPRKRLSKD